MISNSEYDPTKLYVVSNGYKLTPAKNGDAGMDLPVRVSGVKIIPDVTHVVDGEERSIYIYGDHFFIPAGGEAEIPTGLRIKVPDGSWGSIKTRSSTSWKKKLGVFEAVLDSGYTGNCYVLAYNPTNRPIRVDDGDRLAQLIVVPLVRDFTINYISEMPETDRATAGFGSSGR